MQFVTKLHRPLSILTTMCLIVVLTSCANLAAVREWSKTSLEATQYNEIVTTYADTPHRMERYDSTAKEFWEKQYAIRQNQAKALKQILSVVSGYMGALATLSADSTIDYSKDLDTAETSIKKLNAGISDKSLNAIGSLVKTVLGAAAKAYQAKQVSIIVGEANAPLQNILNGELRTIVNKDFRDDITKERTSINGYYNYLLHKGHPSEAAKIALLEWKDFRMAQNAKRLNAVDAYVKVLDKIAKGHQKLYENRNSLDSKALVKDLYSLVTQIRKQIQVLSQNQ